MVVHCTLALWSWTTTVTARFAPFEVTAVTYILLEITDRKGGILLTAARGRADPGWSRGMVTGRGGGGEGTVLKFLVSRPCSLPSPRCPQEAWWTQYSLHSLHRVSALQEIPLQDQGVQNYSTLRMLCGEPFCPRGEAGGGKIEVS
jgi:hypothetical protein